MKIHYAASMLLAAVCVSNAHAGDALIDLDVSVGSKHTSTDMSGGFAVSGLKAGKYDVRLTGNPVKGYLDEDGGKHISLQINGKRFPVTCSPAGCLAKTVPIVGKASGRVTSAE